MTIQLSRRHLLQHSTLAMSSGILAACGSSPKPTPNVTPTANTMPPVRNPIAQTHRLTKAACICSPARAFAKTQRAFKMV